MKGESGLSLIELFVIILILAILASIFVPFYFEILERKRILKVREDFENIGFALEQYFKTNKTYPVKDGELNICLKELIDKEYIGSIPEKDPWGKPYLYTGKETVYIFTCISKEPNIKYSNGKFIS
ncbi:MAG: type II secretion system protein GspG [Actinobacteria bacterium]|nr:type II secretion system protein GspG [Actinomycetota bacterium]